MKGDEVLETIQERKRDFSIEFIRVIAMFMIILDHILAPVDMPMKSVVSQVLNAGVYIFIIISGYLAGRRRVTKWGAWYVRKLKRIMPAFWIVIVMDAVYELAAGNSYSVKVFIVHCLNLQGILGTTKATNTLWFVTLIMILYLITPIYQWLREKKLGSKLMVCQVIVLLCVQVLLAYITDIGLVYGHNLSWCIAALILYGAAYNIKELSTWITKPRNQVIATVALIIAMLTMVAARRLWDGSPVYDKVIAFDAMSVACVCMTVILYGIGSFMKNHMAQQFIRALDKISYEFYLVHELIIVAVTMRMYQNYGMAIYMLGTIGMTVVVAVVVHELVKGIDRGIRHISGCQESR